MALFALAITRWLAAFLVPLGDAAPGTAALASTCLRAPEGLPNLIKGQGP